jgi:multiple sugar transport system substrate-binding protein
VAPRRFDRRRFVQGAAAGTALLGTSASRSLAVPAVHVPRNGRRAQGAAAHVRALMWANEPTMDTNFQNRVTTFNEAHQGEIEVELQFLPYDQYWQKLQLSYAANDPYDIYFWDVQAYGHYKRDLLLNLQPMIDESQVFDPADYPMELFEVWKLDGENLYALPENLQTMGLYYNKTIFDQAGAAVPDDTWSWDQVVEAGKALTVRDGDRVSQWGLDVGAMSVWWGAQTLGWAKGDSFFDRIVEPTVFQVSNDANVEALDFLQGLVNTEKISPNPIVMAQNEEPGTFETGRSAIAMQGSWFMSTYAKSSFEWGMAPLPTWDGNRVVPYWLGGWVIAKASDVADAAFEFARWSASDYQETMAREHDWIPILNSARESEEMASGMPDGFQQSMEALSDARLGDMYHRNNQQIIVEAFEPNLEQHFNGQMTAEDAARNIDAKANELLTA